MINFKIVISFFFLTLFLSVSGISQVRSDTELIFKTKEYKVVEIKHHVLFGVTQSNNFFIKYNPVSLVAGGFMYFYQSALSRQLSATCGFNPSCSEMGKGLIKTYGIFKGTFCTADRLMRCNKISFVNVKVQEFDREDGKVHESVDYYK